MLMVAGKWGCGWIENWFEYVEDQTLGNILCNLLVRPVRYVIFIIQRRSGTLRLCMKSPSGWKRFQWHFREFEADYWVSESHEYDVQLQRQLNLKER